MEEETTTQTPAAVNGKEEEDPPQNKKKEEEPPADDAAPAITNAQLKEALSAIVTQESVGSLTRRIVREKLEDQFKLAREALADRKIEINELLKVRMSALPRPEVASPTVKSESKSAAAAESKSAQPARRKRPSSDAEDGDSSSEAESSSSKEVKKPSAGGGGGGARKAQSALMTRTFFTENAEALESSLGSVKFTATPREFNTGSCGWFYGSKQEFTVAGKPVMCQMTVNCTVLGSKTWKSGAKKKARKSV